MSYHLYLIDTIGKETGMHLYDQSFQHSLEGQGLQVSILSNYDTPQRKALFQNFYHGGKLLMMLRFAWSLIQMSCFFLRHHSDSDIYVYQSFGLRMIDQLFIRTLCGFPRLFVIVHDVFEITGQANTDPRKEQKIKFYNRRIPNIICHSRDTEHDLRDLGYRGRTLCFPHFSYEFKKDIVEAKVAREVRDAWSLDKVNFLFFGQIRETKGILILQQAIRLLEEKYPKFSSKANIIIAGMDKGQLIDREKEPAFVHCILRYMNDNELNWLFSHCPYVLLPYTEIYQSGVLEVVIYFRCPSLLSDIPFFRQVLNEFPSFGQCYAPNTPEALADAMMKIVNEENKKTFSDDDLQRYTEAHDPSRLASFLTLRS